jgi:AraC-like DNA-binding protein
MMLSKEYSGSRMTLIETSFVPHGECICQEAVFIIPLRHAPTLKTEGSLYKLKEESLFACNPMQLYRIADSALADFKALIIYMKKAFLEETAEAMFNGRALEFKNGCFAYSPVLRNLAASFMRECSAGHEGSGLMLESLSVQAAVTILRESRHNLAQPSFDWREYHDGLSMRKAIEYLTDNFQNKITLQALASETHYSLYHFSRLFKTHTGRTPFEFLLEYRIEKAKAMLRTTRYSILQVCDLCGFESISYFCQVFKHKTGVTPTQFRRGV